MATLRDKTLHTARALASLLGATALAGCLHTVTHSTTTAAPNSPVKTAAAQALAQWEHTLDGPSGKRAFDQQATGLDVSLTHGSVQIKPATATVSPQVEWSVKRADGAGAAALDTLKLYFGQDASGKVNVRDEYSGEAKAARPQVEVVLTVPAGTPINASVIDGALTIDTSGKLDASLDKGTLSLQGGPSDSNVKVGEGDIEASVLVKSGHYDWTVDHGKVELMLLKGSDTEYEVSTTRGKLELGGLPSQVERDVQGQRATGQLGQAAAVVTLHVARGDIFLNGVPDTGSPAGE